MIRDIIGDGYDFAGVATDGKLPVRYCYRPMLNHERLQVARLAAHIGGASGEKFILMCAANHVSTWSLEYSPDMTGMERLEQEAPELWKELWMSVAGVRDGAWESESSDNLKEGLALWYQHRGLASITCNDCRRLWLDSKGRDIDDGGTPLLRLAGTPVMCETAEGCPVGHYDNPKRLSHRNVLAFDRHMEWKSTGQFPNDPIVLRNATIIESVLRKLTSGPTKAA